MNRKNWLSCTISIVVLLGGCAQEKDVYTLSESEVNIEVRSNAFDPRDYILKNGEKLSNDEKKEIASPKKIDTSVLGETKITFSNYENMTMVVNVVDTQAPKLILQGFSTEEGVVLTWNEETLAKLKASATDNYDTPELMKKSLHCGTVDTAKIGKQEVVCSIEDSSGNKAEAIVNIDVKAKQGIGGQKF